MKPDGKDKLRIAFIPHGPTQWNDEGRLQGRQDIPLSEAGRLKMSGLRPPAGFESARVFVSPLSRARETARLLGLVDAVVDERLSEHGWGSWEGLTREEIAREMGCGTATVARHWSFARNWLEEAFAGRAGL